ncbi:AHH domain-containing protein [Parageobacillus toebii]|uniref:AHH domain-containing protein n=1 Tax=Parageobacillus toebii TaxID=153151 RepID=UPI002E1A53A8|nr:pre-toxin TG domain-containing protein [Parageobacillus toebii]
MTTIRVNPEELEAVAERVPDAEDGCSRARTSLSWEFPSLVMKIPGISTDAIDRLRDELIHWLDCYEEKLNEAEELLYRTAAAIRQADQTLADNMKEFGLELSGWYDLQRLFGEYDPVTGERISGWDRLFAGGMLLLSVIPPAKEAGVAGKAAIKGVKAAETAADVSKLISKTRNVLNVDKIKGALQTIYHQVVKGPITQTIRSFKQQWEQLLKNVGSVLQESQLALAGVDGSTSRTWMSGVEREAKGTMMNIVGNTGNRTVGKGTGGVAKGTGKPLQKHHYATNKSKKYTPQIEAITKKYGLDLDDVWNIELLPHQGRHPNAYHEYVLSNIRTFDKIAKGDKRKFLRLFEQLKQEIRKNPEMLYKDYWRKK